MINFRNDCLIDAGVDVEVMDVDQETVELTRNEFADAPLDVFLGLLRLLEVVRVLGWKHLLGQKLLVLLLRVLAPVHHHQPGLVPSASAAVPNASAVANYNREAISSVSAAATIITSTHLDVLIFFPCFFPLFLEKRTEKYKSLVCCVLIIL